MAWICKQQMWKGSDWNSEHVYNSMDKETNYYYFIIINNNNKNLYVFLICTCHKITNETHRMSTKNVFR